MSMENASRICTQMLTQRGYENKVIIDENTIKMENGDKAIIVFFDTQPKLNKGSISKYMSIMKEENVTHSIIVYSESVTNMTSKSVEQSLEMKIELFCVDELQFNITKHRLQPKIVRNLTRDENIAFRKQFGIKLPVMRYTDALRRFYNFGIGDIIEMTDARDIVSYRVVK